MGGRLLVFAVASAALLLSAPRAAAQGAWEQLGPDGGELRAIAIDPVTPSMLFVGARFGGVLRSVDAGASWTPVNNGLTNAFVTSLAIHPTTPTTIYAGTEAGVFRSLDRGDHWLPSASGIQVGAVRAIVIDPASPSTIYTRSDSTRISRSTDGGVNWIADNTGLPPFQVAALTIDPLSSTLYAGLAASTPLDIFNPGGGIYQRLPGSTSWTPYENNPSANLGSRTISELYVDGGSPSVIYAQVSNAGLFRKRPIDIVFFPITTFSSVGGIAVTLGPPYLTYVASGDIYKSTDGGAFVPSGSGLPGLSSVDVLKMNPQVPTTLYAAANPDGIYKSVDGGGTWRPAPGVTAQNVRTLVIDPVTPTTVYTSSSSGTYRSVDAGLTWRRLDNSSFDALAIDPQTPGILYGTGSGVARSLDGGVTWTFVPVASDAGSTKAIAIDPQTPSKVYVGSFKGVYRSSDFGVTWAFGTPLPEVQALVIHPSVASTLYAAASSGVYRSLDGGATWKLSGNELIGMSVRALAMDPRAPSVLYAGTRNGVFKSVDAGATWSAINAGLALTSLDVRSIAIDQWGLIYAGIFGHGVYRSTDSGATWTSYNSGLEGIRRNVEVVAVNSSLPGVLYVGTSGSSVLRRVNAPTVTSLDPGVLVRGSTTDVVVNGEYFLPGQTTIDPMAGVTVNDVRVLGLTRLIVSLTGNASAVLGQRSIVVRTPNGASASIPFQLVDPFPDLSISGPGTSTFGEGAAETFALTVRNGGTAPTTGPSTVTTTLPTGLRFVSASGGWRCTSVAAVLTCSWDAPIGVGESVPLTLTLAAGNGAGGSHVFSVSTAGDLISANDTAGHAGTVLSVPLPRITLSTTSLQAGQQVTATVSLPSPFPHDLTGTLTLGFTSDAVVQGDDPAIQFATGGRVVSYVIPANTLTARIGDSAQPGPIGFQTGTVSGTFVLAGSVASGPVQLTYAPVLPSGALTIVRQVPTIHSVETRLDGEFAAYLVTSSTSREVTAVSLQFDTATPVRLSCGAVSGCFVSGSTVTLDTHTLFNSWFSANTALGSLSMLRLPIAIDPGLTGTVTIRLQNSVGTSGGRSFSLP